MGLPKPERSPLHVLHSSQQFRKGVTVGGATYGVELVYVVCMQPFPKGIGHTGLGKVSNVITHDSEDVGVFINAHLILSHSTEEGLYLCWLCTEPPLALPHNSLKFLYTTAKLPDVCLSICLWSSCQGQACKNVIVVRVNVEGLKRLLG